MAKFLRNVELDQFVDESTTERIKKKEKGGNPSKKHVKTKRKKETDI